MACWLISRLITPKSDNWRDSAMRRPKVGQAVASAAASSNLAPALTGMRWSGLASRARLSLAARNSGCGSRPISAATSKKLVSAAARTSVSKPVSLFLSLAVRKGAPALSRSGMIGRLA
ncbi:hypothetical protein D3C72_2096150 [compost metagenome]